VRSAASDGLRAARAAIFGCGVSMIASNEVDVVAGSLAIATKDGALNHPRIVRGDKMALAAKGSGDATPSSRICSVGECPCDKPGKSDDKSANGNDPKSGVHFGGCAGSGTNAMLDGGLVMFG